jgi:hypothetical protein
MPVTYRFDATIVIITLSGEYSMEDIRTTILSALADAQCPTSPCILMDLSESRSIYNRSKEDVKVLSHSLASLAARFNNRIALVAPDDLPYGLMRMGSVFSAEAGFEPEVFRTYAEARTWILS